MGGMGAPSLAMLVPLLSYEARHRIRRPRHYDRPRNPPGRIVGPGRRERPLGMYRRAAAAVRRHCSGRSVVACMIVKLLRAPRQCEDVVVAVARGVPEQA